jgi:succinoglycan biosynthesis transport protein ExoP
MEGVLDLRRYLSVIRHWLWLIVACTLLGAVSAFLASSWMTPVYYRATTSLLVNVQGSTDSDYAAVLASEHLATTYKELLTKRPVIEAAAQTLGLDPSQIEGKVQIRLVPETGILELTVKDTDPHLAMAIADGIVAAFMQIPRESGGIRARDLIVVEPATRPLKSMGSPVQPRALKSTALAAGAGAMLAVAVAFVLEYLDDRIKTPDDVSQALGLETLGAIARLPRWMEELVVAADPLSPIAEACRALCTNIRFSSVDRPLRTILVTSPAPAEGKSIALANLAVAMAQAGLRVVALDADLRRPRLHQLFGLDLREKVTGERSWWGLTGSLREGHTDGTLHPTQVEGLKILPSGELPPNPAEMVGSQHMQKLLHELAQQADVVLIDSPPVLPVTDAAVLAHEVDGVLLVLEAGKTQRGAARHAVESLRQVGANLVGVVLNAVPTHRGSYYYYYHHEYYGGGGGRRKHRLRRRKGPLTAIRRLFERRRQAN